MNLLIIDPELKTIVIESMKDFDEWYPDHEIVSSCCGVAYNTDISICPCCKDHCTGVKLDEDGNEIPVE